MNKIEQVREALEAAKHAMTNQRYLLPRLGTEDAHAKVTSAIAILKDMDGQEPVAWMYKGGDSRYPAYLTLEKDIAEEDADDPSSIIPLYAHPSPSAPVDIAEVIKAGDAVKAAHSRLLAFATAHLPDKALDRLVNDHSSAEVHNAWTTATAKHRIA